MLEDKNEHIETTGPKEILWFIGLWALGFFTITLVGGIIKLFLKV